MEYFPEKVVIIQLTSMSKFGACLLFIFVLRTKRSVLGANKSFLLIFEIQ